MPKPAPAPIQTRSHPLEQPVSFSLNNLSPGVDNYRFDVSVSPDFIRATTILVRTLLTQQLQIKDLPGQESSASPAQLLEAFSSNYQHMILAALTMAKEQNNEAQIDFLAQLAACKTVRQEIQNVFTDLVNTVNNRIWEYESSRSRDPRDVVELKEQLAVFRQQKKTVLGQIARKLFQAMFTAQQTKLSKLRASLFGPGTFRAADLLLNPILLTEPDQFTDDFMLEEYILLGHRLDDIDHYAALLGLVKDIFTQVAADFPARNNNGNGRTEVTERSEQWLEHPENVDILFNPFLPHQDRAERERREERLSLCLDRFQRAKLLDRVVAGAAIRPVYRQFCPPLVPHQVVQFLLEPSSRRNIDRQLARHRKFAGRTVSLTPLLDLAASISRTDKRLQQQQVLDYLRNFCRYHRDRSTGTTLRELMERINLVVDEKVLTLSRANNTLYEFLLPHETTLDLEPTEVACHVILKADVRGAVSITQHLLDNGLNPASYFSLNFFDPITKVVAAYGAQKLFLEGDAIILALAGHQGALADWFGVARACGLAASIVKIIDRYNAHSQKHRLPNLEIGCGISFRNAPPAYLFDEERPIMISPAINRADRLSSNARDLKKLLHGRDRNFNLYVFQAAMEGDERAAVGKDTLWRYNVNGIELDEEGFQQLAREINLQRVECRLADLGGDRHTLYTGTFPTITGKYQRLVIREAEILEVRPGSLEVVRSTGRKYYEVCTLPKLYGLIKKIA